MYINTFRYKPEDVDCKLCTEYRKKLGCAVKGCPFLAERIEAGVVGYGDAVQNTLSRHMALAPRLTALIRLFPGTMCEYSHAWEHPFSRLRACCFSPNFSYLGAPYKHNI